jgi:hypothetical protein
VPDRSAFSYTVIRVVPRVERGERLNAGVVLFSRQQRFLGARLGLDEARLRALAPQVDVAAIRAHLTAIERIAAGDPDAGPIARMDRSERFGWLAAPSSTMIQPSRVHTGLCEDPQAALDRLYAELVAD